jgi:hypothetical protein
MRTECTIPGAFRIPIIPHDPSIAYSRRPLVPDRLRTRLQCAYRSIAP